MKRGFPCPVCGYLTRSQAEHDTYEICPVCFWEDDPVQFGDPGYAGGANDVSLEEARRHFSRIGASSPRFVESVRKPASDEIP